MFMQWASRRRSSVFRCGAVSGRSAWAAGRAKLRAALLPSIALVLVATSAACNVGITGKAGPGGTSRWPGKTGPVVVGAHCVKRLDLDGYAEAFRAVRGPDWSGGDMAVAAVLGGDIRLWLFGDTYTGVMTPEGRILDPWDLVHNSFVIQRGKCFEFHMGVVDGVISELVADRSSHRRYWPGGAYVVRKGGRITELRVLAVVGLKPPGADGAFSVRLVGAALLRMSWPDLNVLAIEQLGAPGELIMHHVIAGGDGWRYIYAAEKLASPTQYVARGRDSDLLRGRLSWWDGDGWSRSAADAAPMEFLDGDKPDEGPWSPLYVTADEPGFVASATRLQLMTTDVTAWWSEHPWGPWQTASPKQGRIATMPQDDENYRYGGHIEMLPGLGPTVLWNHHPGFREVVKNAYVFGPRFAAPEGFTTPWRPAQGG